LAKYVSRIGPYGGQNTEVSPVEKTAFARRKALAQFTSINK